MEKERKNNNIIIFLMTIISTLLCGPSILYLLKNGSVDGFSSYYSYTLMEYQNKRIGLINGLIVIGLITIFSLLYFYIIKKEKYIFKDVKQILIFIAIISFIFMIILPYQSSDIYYYIGDSWLAAKYNENPYYTTIKNLLDKNIKDEILENAGTWSPTVTVYGPLWNIISILLVKLSFGKVTVALFIFKIANFIVHLFNTYLFKKITKSRKYMLLYGLNPLILMELLSNVHNEIYVIMFLLLTLYFMIKKKNKFLTLLFLSFAISIKSTAVLIVPFIIIYLYRKEKIFKRICYSFLSGIFVLLIAGILYIPFYRDYRVFIIVFAQIGRYSQSIKLFLLEILNINLLEMIEKIIAVTFVLLYLLIVFKMLFSKKIEISKLMRNYNFLFLFFIYLVLTNYHSWYITLLLPNLIWQKKYMRKFVLNLTIASFFANLEFFINGADIVTAGIFYSILTLSLSSIAIFLEKFYIKIDSLGKN